MSEGATGDESVDIGNPALFSGFDGIVHSEYCSLRRM
jgi:hypothetical protein